jgi:phosphoglycerate kinase
MSQLVGIKTLRDLNVENKRVFVRVDFNCPLEDGKVTDDSRIREALPTITHLMQAGAKVILASHLGRPKPGKHEGLSLEPVALRLAELLKAEVHLPEDCIGDSVKKVIFDLRSEQVCLLENLRFHEAEEKNDEDFARALAELADAYVCDAFGAVHRAHASVQALPRLFQERAAGFLLEKELASLGNLIGYPDKPYLAILGGSKVSDKIDVIEALLGKVSAIAIGGAMANTFLAAKNHRLGKSRIEQDKVPLALSLLKKADTRNVKVLLPTDLVVAADPNATEGQVVLTGEVTADVMALDIGPTSANAIADEIAKAKTVFWNGPMGMFERAPFASGSFRVAQAMAEASGFTVVGGGDSAACVHAAGESVASAMKHISTGGGASLELIEGKKLPGIEALRLR